MRYFLSRVARAVRRGEIEVHSFCIMATHFHLLVRSPTGRLSEAMRRIQNEYVRYFNRKRRRDGEDVEILARRAALYASAKDRNPSRWTQRTRDWRRQEEVALNPSPDTNAASEAA